MKPRRPGTRAGRAGLVYRGPRTSRCGPPRRRLRRLCPPWRSGRRPGRRPTRRRSRRKVAAACPLGSAGPRTSAAGARPAASRRREREITEKCSTRRVLSRPSPTARWARRASGGGAATTWTVQAWRPRAGAVATTLTLSGPFTWVVSRTFPISTLDASLSPISRAAFARRPGGPKTTIASTISSTDLDGFTRAQKAAEPASRARCQSAWRAVATRRRARLMAAAAPSSDGDRRSASETRDRRACARRRRHDAIEQNLNVIHGRRVTNGRRLAERTRVAAPPPPRGEAARVQRVAAP